MKELIEERDLMPVNGRKSFYGKAQVRRYSDGSEELYSYNTLICTRNADGTITRHCPYWSATTGIHINAFCGMKKKEFCELPITEKLLQQ